MKQFPKLKIIYLPVSDLVKLPNTPRIDTDPDAINRWAGVSKAHGFANPLNVYKVNGKHEIIAGNHRFDAGLSLTGQIDFMNCLLLFSQ